MQVNQINECCFHVDNSCHVISYHQQNHVTSNEEVASERKDHGKSTCLTLAVSCVLEAAA